MVSAWFAGLGPGLLATTLAMLTIDYFFMQPIYSILIFSHRDDAIRLGVFVLVAVLINGLDAAHRRAQAVSEDARRFLQTTLDSLVAQVIIIDGDGVSVAANEAWRRAGGAAPGTRYLQSLEVAGGDPDGVAAGVRDVLERRRETFTAEVRRDVAGAPRWLAIHATRLEGAGLLRVVVSHDDVTERKRAEEAERTAEALRSVARLATAAGHEINNPLATILGNLELLARQLEPDEPSRERILRSLDAVQRIREIVARLADITELRVADPRTGLPEMLDLRGSGAPGDPPP